MRLRRQLLVPLFVLVILPTSGLIVFAATAASRLANSSRDLANELAASHRTSVHDVERAREAATEQRRDEVRLSATWIAHDLTWQQRRLQDLSETIRAWPIFRLCFVASPSARSGHLSQLTYLLNDLVARHGLSEASLLDRDGKEIIRIGGRVVPAGGDPLFDGVAVGNATTDESSALWYQNLAKNLDHTFTLHADPDFPNAAPSLSYAAPLRIRASRLANSLDQMDGILRLTMPAETALGESLRVVTTPDSRIFIRDDAGVMHSSDENGHLIFIDPSELNDADAVITHDVANTGLQVIAVIPKGGLDRASEQVQLVLARLRTGAQEVTQLESQASRQRGTLLTAGFIALSSLAFILATGMWWIRRILLLPLQSITDSSRHLAEGQLDQPVASYSSNEIGTLASDLERMRLKLRHQVEALEVANHDLERATRMKSQFLANMSHEIRTPMNGVLGMAQLLTTTQLDEEQSDLLNTLRSSGESMLGVINDILDLSKIEAGEMRLEAIPLDLRAIADLVVDVTAEMAHAKQLFIAADIDPRLNRPITGDPTRLRQVLLNLVSNAVKFTNSGHVLLSIRVVSTNTDRVELSISVTDTGIGISNEMLPNLFRPFTQADGSTTRRFGGTGLGLAISKHLVEAMGGTVSVHSEPGQGSVFTLTLGALWADVISEDAPFIGTKVCLFCDEPVVAGATIHHLMAAGVKPSHHPFSAISDELTLHAVPIIDIGLRTIEGLDLALLANLPKPPILIVSRKQRQRLTSEIRSAASAVISGPGRYDTLVRSLRDHQHQEERDTTSDVRNTQPLGLRVLLVEDIPVNRTVALSFLRRLGCETTSVENGVEALEACAHERFDAVLMDCQMPEMDGFEATRRLRQDGTTNLRGEPIPIIGLTAGAMEDDLQACSKAGMDTVLTKPVKLEDLGRTLRRYAGHTRLR
jgi:signal transduction histidine kinase/CheY-like chemotaxis protein